MAGVRFRIRASIKTWRTSKSWPDRWPVFFGSVPAGWLAVVFWRQEAIAPLTASGLLVDRTLQILTLGAVPAAVVLVLGVRSLTLPAAVYLAMSGLVLSVAVATTGLLRPPADWKVVAVAIVGVAAGSWLVYRYVPRMQAVRSAVAKILTALLVAAVPILQFWNGVAFLPGQTEAILQQNISIETVGMEGTDLHSNLVVRATNLSDVRLLVILTKVRACWWGPGETVIRNDDELHEREGPGENCVSFEPFAEGAWIPPKAELVFQRVLPSPVDKRRLVVIAEASYARGDRLRVSGAPAPIDDRNGCVELRAVQLDEESRLKGMAQDDKYLVYGRRAHLDTNFFFDAGSIVCPGRGAPDELQEYFGATSLREIYEEWLVDPPAPT